MKRRWFRKIGRARLGFDVEILSNLDELAPALIRKLGPAVMSEGRVLLASSQAQVPVDKGDLKASGMVTRLRRKFDRVATSVAYGRKGIAYAVAVHEIPGRRGHKYLERPARAQAKGYSTRIGAAIAQELQRAGTR